MSNIIKSERLSRKKAYLETNGELYRIVKGKAKSDWMRPTEVAFLTEGERVYFAFQSPLQPMMPLMDANVIYYAVKCKTDEKIIGIE